MCRASHGTTMLNDEEISAIYSDEPWTHIEDLRAFRKGQDARFFFFITYFGTHQRDGDGDGDGDGNLVLCLCIIRYPHDSIDLQTSGLGR